MALSQDLVSQFAKLANNKKEDSGATMRGTYKKINGVEYVQLDGSEILTPVESQVEAETGERVSVLIKDHMATITGNITSPSARNKDVNNLKDEVDEFGNTIKQMDNSIVQQGNSIIQIENNINQQQTTINQHDTKINQQGDEIVSINNTIIAQGNSIEANNNAIIAQGNQIESMNNTISQQGDNINSMNNTISAQGNKIDQQANTISQQGNTIQQHSDSINSINNSITLMDNSISAQNTKIDAINSTVQTYDSSIAVINSAFIIQDGVITGLSKAVLDSLETGTLSTGYAKIDFSNINIAAIEHLFSESGIIKDLTVQDGAITGELVGVTIRGDSIIGNTIIADKLVVLGDDGLYYKLNTTGETVSAEQTDKNSLNGKVITAKSITAEKIQVTDLVAFGATIGKFVIGDDSIHTNTKASINSDAVGLYMGSDGQWYLGGPDEHIKYYKETDADGNVVTNDNGDPIWVLDIRMNKLYIGTSDKTLGETIEEQKATNGDLYGKIGENQSLIEQSNKEISTRVEEVNTNLGNDIQGISDDLKDSVDKLNISIQKNTTLIQQYATSIINTVKETGGDNRLRNSVGFSGTDFWVSSGSISTYQDDSMSLSGSAFLLTGVASMRQSYNTQIGLKYSVSCKVRHKHVGSGDKVSIKIHGQGDKIITLYEGTESLNDWTLLTLDQPYAASITNPYIEIKCEGNDTLEITDLIIAPGENIIWSGYIDEVYGKEHKLDKNGLRLSNLSTDNSSKTTSTNFQILNGSEVVAELSKNKVKSDTGVFANGYSIGRLQVVALDNDNIIEYV